MKKSKQASVARLMTIVQKKHQGLKIQQKSKVYQTKKVYPDPYVNQPIDKPGKKKILVIGDSMVKHIEIGQKVKNMTQLSSMWVPMILSTTMLRRWQQRWMALFKI
jgi:hypothetical protein